MAEAKQRVARAKEDELKKVVDEVNAVRDDLEEIKMRLAGYDRRFDEYFGMVGEVYSRLKANELCCVKPFVLGKVL